MKYILKKQLQFASFFNFDVLATLCWLSCLQYVMIRIIQLVIITEHVLLNEALGCISWRRWNLPKKDSSFGQALIET